MKKLFIFIIILFSLPLKAELKQSDITQVIMLGTGTPFNDAEHRGQSIAIIVKGNVYLVDFGPGLMRQMDAAKNKGFKYFPSDTIRPTFIKKAFLTHLDSDHTMGIAELLLTPWTLGRKVPLDIFGPPNTETLVEGILNAYQTDIKHRLNGAQPANKNGYKANVTIIKKEGEVYKDEFVTVEAFNVRHGDWADGHALGYKFTTPDRVIVLSGDTTYDEEVIKNYEGADILIHEVYSLVGLFKRSQDWITYHSKAHTSTKQLGDIARKIKPKLLVLNHILYFGTKKSVFNKEFKRSYNGDYLIAKDLDSF